MAALIGACGEGLQWQRFGMGHGVLENPPFARDL